jgi:hypothetical protein
MAFQDQVLIDPKLPIRHPDLGGRPAEQIHDEGGRLFETGALRQVREGEILRRPCAHRPLAYGRPPTF